MKKRVFGKKFSRNAGSRRALFRSIIKALIERGTITTTKAKAKAVQGKIDRIITLAKKKSISGHRQIFSFLGNDKSATDLIFTKIAPVFENRTSGFTRIINLQKRTGDLAQMVRFEWVEKIETSIKKQEGKLKSKNDDKEKSKPKSRKSS